MFLERLRADWRAMAKPRAIEEVGDIYLIRPLGFLLVQLLRHTPLTPTAVSVLAVLAGWGAAGLYFASARHGTVPSLAALAALALLLHSALDSADGQLARLTGASTPLGRIVDGFCDNLSFAAIYLAIVAAQHVRDPAGTAAVALLAVAAAASHSLQSSLVEYQRTLYLYAVHGRTDLVDALPGRQRTGGPPSPPARLLAGLSRAYFRQQRLLLPTTARLERLLVEIRERDPAGFPAVGARHGRRQRTLLPWWALLASNSHKAGIALAAFIPVGEGSFWAGLGMAWYLVYDLALNLAMALLIAAQSRLDARTIGELRGKRVA